MKLKINAICNSGPASEDGGALVSVGGMVLRCGKLSTEVELPGREPWYLLIVDGAGGHEKGAAGVVWRDGKVYLVDAGDGGACGRTYLFRDGIVEQLGREGSGGGAGAEITDKLQEGDIILICSVGLGDVVNDDYLEYFLMNSMTPAEELAEWAVENGSTDNVCVIAARVGGGEFGDPDESPDDDGRFDAWA